MHIDACLCVFSMSSIRRQQSDTSATVQRPNERDLHGSSVMGFGSPVYEDVSVVATDNYMGLSGREDSSSYTSLNIREASDTQLHVSAQPGGAPVYLEVVSDRNTNISDNLAAYTYAKHT